LKKRRGLRGLFAEHQSGCGRRLKATDIQERFKAQGVIPATGTAQNFAAIIRDEYRMWREFVTRTGIKVE
jgi:tripartite-type tricarboxylate transporter receptor subunit TctC